MTSVLLILLVLLLPLRPQGPSVIGDPRCGTDVEAEPDVDCWNWWPLHVRRCSQPPVKVGFVPAYRDYVSRVATEPLLSTPRTEPDRYTTPRSRSSGRVKAGRIVQMVQFEVAAICQILGGLRSIRECLTAALCKGV